RRARRSRFSYAIESEKLFCCCGRRTRYFFQRNPARGRDRFGDESRVRWFAAFPAKWGRREIRAIGFDHECVQRNLCGDCSHGCTIFKCNNSGEGNQVAKIENLVRLLEGSAKTMKHDADLSTVIAQDFQCVVPSVTLVNYHV